MKHLLIVEDEPVIRSAVRRLLERTGYQVSEAESVENATRVLDQERVDLVLADLRLPGVPGTEIIAAAGDIPVLIMTSYASVRSAVEAMKLGAVDYIAKPFDHDEMLLCIGRALEQSRLRRQNVALKTDVARNYPITGMVGSCKAMRDVWARIDKAAPTDTTVLILGESGTGKELVARALHEKSARRDGPLISVNCASIPAGLIENELFGHEKGSFTGAVGRQQGLVEAADGGTLFLDEVGELSLETQARLLRVLEEGEMRRVGAARPRRVDIRLVAATHRDLRQLIADRTFREDLFFRLHVVEIEIPPLRERGDDIPELAQSFLHRSCEKLHRPNIRFQPAALDAMRHYPWPGNVRELENAVERAVILCDHDEVTPELLSLRDDQDAPGEPPETLNLSLEGYFRLFVQTHQVTLTETELAERLGISRKALWERRQRLGIPRSKPDA